jgi:hypothetical protein
VTPIGKFFDYEIQEIVPPKNHDTIKCSHFEQDGIKTHGISVKIGNKSAETAPKTRQGACGHRGVSILSLGTNVFIKIHPSVPIQNVQINEHRKMLKCSYLIASFS